MVGVSDGLECLSKKVCDIDMYAWGVSGVEVTRVMCVTCGFRLVVLTDGDLEDFSSRGRRGCGGIGMCVGVVGRGEFASEIVGEIPGQNSRPHIFFDMLRTGA